MKQKRNANHSQALWTTKHLCLGIVLLLLPLLAQAAEPFKFEKPVYRILPSSSGDFCCILFRERKTKQWATRGEAGIWIPERREMLWTTKHNYQNAMVRCCDQGILKTTVSGTLRNPNTVLLDHQTGKKLWRESIIPVLNDDTHNMLLGYRSTNPNQLVLLWTNTGKPRGEQTMSQKFGSDWNHAVRLDDECVAVVSDGLNIINLRTGGYETYECETGSTHTGTSTALGLGNLLGAASLFFAGHGFFMFGNDALTGTHSNILFADSCLYFADRQEVMSLNRHLMENWVTKLPEKTASKSVLALRDSILYMLNMGYGRLGTGRAVKNGKPFIALFDKRTGKQQYLHQLSEKKKMMTASLITDSRAWMLLDGNIICQPDLTDSVTTQAQWDERTYGEALGFVNDTIYIRHEANNTFTPLCSTDDEVLIYTSTGDRLISCRPSLECTESYPFESIWHRIKTDRYIIYMQAGNKEIYIEKL